MTSYVLITGASGGFGCEFAVQLEQMGYTLLLHGRDKVRLCLTQDRLQSPEKHETIFSDLTEKKDVELFLDNISEYSICGLVNNAGFGIWGGFHQREINLQMGVLETDLFSPVYLAHALLPQLIKHKGFMINVSSLSGETPLPYMSTYASAKAGLTFWSEALRYELEKKLTVVTLAPGPSPTGFRDISGMPIGKGNIFRNDSANVVASALRCLKKGGGYCIPGFRHKLLYAIQKITPRLISLRLMRKYLK